MKDEATKQVLNQGKMYPTGKEPQEGGPVFSRQPVFWEDRKVGLQQSPEVTRVGTEYGGTSRYPNSIKLKVSARINSTDSTCDSGMLDEGLKIYRGISGPEQWLASGNCYWVQ